MEGILNGFLSIFIMLFKWALRLLRGVGRLSWRVIKYLFLSKSKTFGSARWAKKKEIKKSLKGQGLIVGKQGNKFIRYNDQEGMAIIFAPTRSGKGVGFVIPNLLTYRGSLFTTDPKGENYAITKRQRQKFGEVFCLNIKNPHDSSHYNPLDSIRKGTFKETDDATKLAELMLVPDPKEPTHWREKAKEWLAGFILYTLYKYEDEPLLCTLTEVRNLTQKPAATFEMLLEEMEQSTVATVRETGTSILAMQKTSECSGILSSLEKGTRPFSAGRAAAIISSKSDFGFTDLNAVIKSIYLVVPPEDMEQYAGYMRVITGLVISGLQREGKKSETPPLLLLDEVAILGYLEPLEKGMGFLATYARLILVFQDYNQLSTIYPKSLSIISNSGCQIYFGVNEIGTAKAVSERIGNLTIKTRTQGQSQAHDAILSHQEQAGSGEAGRALIDPSEITRLPLNKVVIFMKNTTVYPIKADAVKYYKDSFFKGLYDNWER